MALDQRSQARGVAKGLRARRGGGSASTGWWRDSGWMCARRWFDLCVREGRRGRRGVHSLARQVFCGRSGFLRAPFSWATGWQPRPGLFSPLLRSLPVTHR